MAFAGRTRPPATPAEAPSPGVAAAATVPPPPPAAPPAAPALWEGGLPVALQTTPKGVGSLSAMSCNACHGAAHDQWAQSAHAMAWRDPLFQEALARVADATACTGCHLPLANQHSQLATGLRGGDPTRPEMAPNPLWDAGLMTEGVTCAACHVRGDTVISTRPSPGAPHPVAVSAELGTSEACATCHQLTWPGADKPFYDTYGEWKASAYAPSGVRCQDCHMAPQAGPAAGGRFAAVAGHAGEADLRRALTVLVQLDAPAAQRGAPLHATVRVRNSGAGHHVPTGSPFVGLVVRVRLVGADGKPLAEDVRRDFTRTVAEAPPWPTLTDTRLAPGAESVIDARFTVDQKKSAQSARLLVEAVRHVGTAEDPPIVLRDIPVPVR